MPRTIGPGQREPAPNLWDAACYGVEDPDIFFAEDAVNPDRAKVAAARELCLSCVRQAPCLIYAMKHEQWGMWGGLTANERDMVKQGLTSRLPEQLQALVEAARDHG